MARRWERRAAVGESPVAGMVPVGYGRNTMNRTTHRGIPAGCPQWSPWGEVQTARDLGGGVWFVSTASHGGIYVPQTMLDAMPAALRCNRYSGGGQWFEEDVEWALVAVWRPELFPLGFRCGAKRTILAYRGATGHGGLYAAAAEWVAEHRPISGGVR